MKRKKGNIPDLIRPDKDLPLKIIPKKKTDGFKQSILKVIVDNNQFLNQILNISINCSKSGKFG